jgi:enamine deaminase RidA (YjgF/YER057c/UK114 family)
MANCDSTGGDKMNRGTLPVTESPLRTECVCSKDDCSGETVAFETPCATEIYFRCAPTLAEGEMDFEQQVRRFYGCLPRCLAEVGGDMSNVILERAFFENFADDMETFQTVRKQAYASAGVPGDELPAPTYIQQPPCRASQKIELHVHAIVPKPDQSVTVKTFHDLQTQTTAKVVEIAGYKHLYITDIKGLSGDPENPGTFREQSDRMFANCARLLKAYGVTFPHVARTWCYMTDIDNTYDEFNLSRNAFFADEGVTRLPASTGIEAKLYPPEALCGMDLYAILNPDGVEVEIMKTPTLNEAPEYGSAFSRGMRVDLPDKTVLHISGTASVDEKGDTVHLDDPRKQIERMLLNVRELLKPHGATMQDLTQAATFLKHKEYLAMYEEILEQWGIRKVPNTLVEAGVCRPNLLCEMEAVAVLPKRSLNGERVATNG